MIIPVYNEVDTIGSTLACVLAVPGVGQVVIVNDGSDDGTAAVLDSATDPRVRVLHQPVKKGKGASIRIAIPHLSGDLTVIQDADMEYDPSQLPGMAEIIRRGESEVVYGSRFRGHITGMRPINWLGNRVLTLVTNLLFGSHLTDEATCYKMFRTTLLQGMPLRCTRFEFCPEVTARLLRQGIPIAEVPISYHARAHSAGKKIRWWDLVDAIATLIRYRFTE